MTNGGLAKILIAPEKKFDRRHAINYFRNRSFCETYFARKKITCNNNDKGSSSYGSDDNGNDEANPCWRQKFLLIKIPGR